MPSSPQSLSQIPSDKSPQREPLAVIGIGCRFPGSVNSPASYWDALLSGTDAICEVPDDRWRHRRFHDTDPERSGRIRNAKGGFITDVDQFDGEFFGYFPNEARRIDPQQRLLLEVTHEAMEDAGLRRDQLEGSRTAVFVGSFMYDYLCIQSASEQRDEINPYVAMGSAVSPLANRLSYNFDLKGPSVALDTACSSSLVAIHMACRSIWNGEADMAFAGGVNIMLRPESSIMMSKAGFLNPDQYCKAFDASANGYVRGEGVGVVMLKPLSRAIADGDHIYAQVCGTGVNQDGFLPEGFTVPNVVSQIALLESVYAEAQIDPLTVDYVEAHGTGTPVGDPIESLALGAVLGHGRESESRELIMGSVKTNLGHLEGAAGIAGFIKAALTAYHGVVPPNLHFHQPNPEIDFDNLHLKVPTEVIPLSRTARPVTVGVNSFGAGGTNAHVVLQESRTADAFDVERTGPARNAGRGRATLYMISSVHREALRSLAARHADLLSTSQEPLEDIAWSAFTRRSRYRQVVAVVAEDAGGVEDKLRRFAAGEVDPSVMTASISRKREPKLAFIFSGQGGQWAQMGLQLMEREPVFRESMEEIEGLFQALAGASLLEELSEDADTSRVNNTVVVQPSIMAVQVSLVRLYASYGIRPEGVVGHSIGEVAAAFASGALTLEQAVEVIFHRSRAQDQASGRGGMLAVGLSFDDARLLIKGYAGVSIGAVNGPEMLTLSGDTAPLEQIAAVLESRGVFNRSVRVQVAYHSHHMDAIEDTMLKSLAHVQGARAGTRLYSTVTGQRENGTHLNAEYWFQNARQPVLFTDALSAMLKDEFDTFVEVGPHPVLINGGEAVISRLDTDAIMVPSMTRREPEVTVFLQSLARLAARGLNPDSDRIFGTRRRYVRLPATPWQHRRYWFEAPAATEMRLGQFEHPFLKRGTQMATEDGLAVWEASIDLQKFPWLNDHQIDGEIVFPGTGHLELAWAVASEQYRYESFFLEDIRFDSPLIFPDNSRHPLEVRLEIVSGEGDYRICSRSVDNPNESNWSKHSSGRINTTHDRFEPSTESLANLREQLSDAERLDVALFYESAREAGLGYGENFRCIREIAYRKHELLARVELPSALRHESSRNFMHPVLLDACLHVVFAEVQRIGDPEIVFLPYRIDRLRLHGRTGQMVWSHVRVTHFDENCICLDTIVFNERGELVAEVLGITCKRLSNARTQIANRLYEGCYEYVWTPAPSQETTYYRNYDYTTAALIIPPDAKGVAETLAMRLNDEGVGTRIIAIDPEESFDESLRDISLDRRTLVVFAPGLSTSSFSWKGLSESPYVEALLQLAKTMHVREGVPRLCVLTTSAAAVDGDNELDLGHAVLHGMARVIRNEFPNLPTTVLDIGASPEGPDMVAIVRELLYSRRDRDESEVAMRGESRYVRQLIPVDAETAERAAVSQEAGFGGNYRADVGEHGSLDQIEFRRLPPAFPGRNDVEIAVQAAALNFKDVMNAMALLPSDAVAGGLTGDRLGLEVAGRVLRAGPSVTNVQVGDDVIARVAEGFCGRVITDAAYVVRRPERLTAQQAAAVPLVYVTAWYSLCHLARITKGETVLVHSAAGGVGGAAIQLSRCAGATVIATAGTEKKREMLRDQGIQHVFDSRSLEFFNLVLDATGGRGVDIVLNSLSGRFVTQSLKCLAPFGRFVELGKADIYRNSKLNLAHLGQNISWFTVDVDRLALQQPGLHRQAMLEILELFNRGELNPHEITEFPISKLPDALRFMTRAAYSGKIVVSTENVSVPTLPPRHVTFPKNRTYLITGGASGFGLVIARWMVERGARHLVLLSRSGCKENADRAVIADMRQEGVEVELPMIDITDAASVGRLFERVKVQMPPLAGIIHGAAVLDDASIPNMDMSRFERVFRPKADGAWNLHVATVAAGMDLDFFVMLSSISSVLGLFGQMNYAAANFFQDSLAHFRRQRGLPATSVNLGVLGQYAGMSKLENEDLDILGLLESQGMLVMTLTDVLSKLEAALIQQPVQRMTARFDWSRFRATYPHLVRDARFIDLMSDVALARGSRPRAACLRTVLSEMEPADRTHRLQQEITASLARILDAEPEKIDVTDSLDNFGLDSLMLTDLQVSLVRALDVNLPLIKLLKGPSISMLSSDLLVELECGESGVAPLSGRRKDASADFTLADLEGITVVNPWLIRGDCDPNAPIRLICFHSMGVGASLFTRFLLEPPRGYDIIAVQTPGRENRASEPIVESVDELVERIVPHLLRLNDRPLVIWGHSFGGVVAWEIIRRLLAEGRCAPAHFVVTGTEAPHAVPLWQKREIMLKAMVPDNSPEYLLSQSRFVDNPEFFKRIIVPGIRRDMPLLQSYRFRQLPPLSCPITAFAARKDDMVYSDRIREWAAYTNCEFEFIEVDGDHWFLDRNRELIAATLREIAAGLSGTELENAIQLGTVQRTLH